MRRAVSGEVDRLCKRWLGKGEGAWGDMLDQSLFLAREHARLFAGEHGANREHHLLYCARNVLNLLAAALERQSEVR
jgi:hypothetical protein